MKFLVVAVFILGCFAEPQNHVPVEETVKDTASVVDSKGDVAALNNYQSDFYTRYYMASAGKGYFPLSMASKGYVPLSMASKGYVPLSMASKTYTPTYMYMSAYYRNLMFKKMVREAAVRKLQAEAVESADDAAEAPLGSKGQALSFDYNPGNKCNLPKDVGPCVTIASEKRYFFNKNTNQCEEFAYGTCLGNANNFKTLKDCQNVCSCGLPPVRGPCYGLIPRFYFNTITNKCEKFFYGGCGGNYNNFQSEKQCQASCACRLPSDTGLCRAAMPRWYHNAENQRCEVFIYGGCLGNSNNFMTKGGCEDTC